MTSRIRLGPAAVLVAVAAAACSSNTPGDISDSASKQLIPQVQQLRELAAAGSYAQLRAAVANLKRIVEQDQQSGEISASRATAIEDAADVLLQDAKPTPTPTPTITTTTPSPVETTVSPTPTFSPTASPTPTSESPSPEPSDTSSPGVSATIGTGNKHHSPSASPARSTSR